jgi:hypothetical protein
MANGRGASKHLHHGESACPYAVRVFRKSGYRFCAWNTRKLKIRSIFPPANRIPLSRKMLRGESKAICFREIND